MAVENDLEVIEAHREAFSRTGAKKDLLALVFAISTLIAEVRELRRRIEDAESAYVELHKTAEPRRAMLERLFPHLNKRDNLKQLGLDADILHELAKLIEGNSDCPTCGSPLKLTCLKCGEGMGL